MQFLQEQIRSTLSARIQKFLGKKCDEELKWHGQAITESRFPCCHRLNKSEPLPRLEEGGGGVEATHINVCTLQNGGQVNLGTGEIISHTHTYTIHAVSRTLKAKK